MDGMVVLRVPSGSLVLMTEDQAISLALDGQSFSSGYERAILPRNTDDTGSPINNGVPIGTQLTSFSITLVEGAPPSTASH
jgi:hypothetical protein